MVRPAVVDEKAIILAKAALPEKNFSKKKEDKFHVCSESEKMQLKTRTL